MTQEIPTAANGVPRTLESFASPIEAFDIVAGELLTEAAERGIIDFSVNGLGTIDAIDALNTVGKHLDEHPEEVSWEEKFALLRAAHETPEHQSAFSFGIEAVLKDGVASIWRPQ